MQSKTESTLTSGHVIDGQVHGDGDLLVQGTIRGDIQLAGTIVVDRGGRVEGSIRAEHVMIAGFVDGGVTARDLLEIADTGTLMGSCTAPRLLVAEGGTVRAKMAMSGQTAGADREPLLQSPGTGTSPRITRPGEESGNWTPRRPTRPSNVENKRSTWPSAQRPSSPAVQTSTSPGFSSRPRITTPPRPTGPSTAVTTPPRPTSPSAADVIPRSTRPSQSSVSLPLRSRRPTTPVEPEEAKDELAPDKAAALSPSGPVPPPITEVARKTSPTLEPKADPEEAVEAKDSAANAPKPTSEGDESVAAETADPAADDLDESNTEDSTSEAAGSDAADSTDAADAADSDAADSDGTESDAADSTPKSARGRKRRKRKAKPAATDGPKPPPIPE